MRTTIILLIFFGSVVCLSSPVSSSDPQTADPASPSTLVQAVPASPQAALDPSAVGRLQPPAEAPPAKIVTLNPDSSPANLVIRNRNILELRADVAGQSPHMRVSHYQSQFANAISGADISEPVAKDFPPYGVVIHINNQTVAAVAHLDLDPLADKSLEQVVAETVEVFSQLLAEIREERSTGAMLKASGLSLLATVAMVLIIWLLLYIRKKIMSILASTVETTSGAISRVTRLDLSKLSKISVIAQRLSAFAVVVFIIFLIITWLAYVLNQFPYTRPWGEGIWRYVLETCRSMGMVVVKALPDLFKIGLIFLFARLIAKLAALIFEAAETGRISLPGIYPETVKPTRRIVMAIIYIFAMVACYPYMPGSSSDAFKGMTVLIGLMLTLGGSGVINQAMSGLVLMYTRAHQIGDYVRIGETEGVVTALDMLATKIRTNKREEVTIPSSVVLNTATKNFTRLAGQDGVILHTTVTIGYSAPWRKVHKILIEAANRTAGLRKQPPAFVMQTALSDFYVEYQLNANLEQPETRIEVLGELHSNIQDSFNEAGIAIVSPHYEADPPQPMPF